MTKNSRNNKKTQIIATGFGGQGIILIGRILGKTAALGDDRESTLVQSYGPESRGGACSAQVVIADELIHYPYVSRPDVLICMSQGGYGKFNGQLAEGGTLIIDTDLVKPHKPPDNFFAIPATRMAEELGRKMMANIIMVGFFTTVTSIISLQATQATVESSVPKGTEKLNINAFNKGCDYGLATLKGQKKKAAGHAGAIA